MDVRNLDELEADGNLGALGATNWVHIPIPELESAIELDDYEFEQRYNYPKFTFDDQVGFKLFCRKNTLECSN